MVPGSEINESVLSVAGCCMNTWKSCPRWLLQTTKIFEYRRWVLFISWWVRITFPPLYTIEKKPSFLLFDNNPRISLYENSSNENISLQRIDFFQRFHVECPWPSAQAEIASLAAYKTPKDKVSCVCRCAATIMNLLAMASEGNIPAADDFVPVLVFVLITVRYLITSKGTIKISLRF